jgi:hypothetical protein
MRTFLNDTLASLTSSVIFTFLIFFLNEKVFKKANLTGEWDVKTKTKKTAYNPYRDIKLYYKFHLLQKGSEIVGSGEKIKEIKNDGSILSYDSSEIIPLEIIGHYERRFLGKSYIYLNIKEKGQKRESRATYNLKIINKNLIKGYFKTTAADSKGTIVMKKP